ncbi:MAG: cytidylate kinase-like family protein, partial [Ruthenibacterium sp.]
TNDKLFLFQMKTIKEMADREPCVIIGRCADYILRGYKKRLSVFIHAPLELRIQRIAKLHNIDEDAARSMIKKTDKNRANFYNFYADSDWGSASTYDLCLNAGKLGIPQSIELLCGAAEHMR